MGLAAFGCSQYSDRAAAPVMPAGSPPASPRAAPPPSSAPQPAGAEVRAVFTDSDRVLYQDCINKTMRGLESPGVPADRVKILRDAFGAMTKDELFLKEAEKMGLEISLIRGEDMNRDVEETVRDKRLMEMYRTITEVK